MKAAVLLVSAVVLLAAATPAQAEPATDSDRQIDQALGQLEVIIEKYDTAREKLKISRSAAEELAARLDPMRSKVAALNADVGRLAAAMYRGGSMRTANALLNTQSPETLANKLAIIDHLAHVNRRQVDALNLAKADLEQQKRELDAVLEQQTRGEREIAARKATIEQKLTALTTARWGDPTRISRTETRDNYVPPFRLGMAGSAVQFAYSQIGRPYVFGAEGPTAYDCSGLTMAAWRGNGIQLPHSVTMQRDVTETVPASDLRPGDLIFYFDDLHHVGLYVGAGRMIHAPQPGQRVTMAPINDMPIHSFGRPKRG